MSDQNHNKLNHLLESLSDTTLVSSRWLRADGYAGNLVARYMAGSWLQSPARGVYLRKGGRLTWEGLLRSLQLLEQIPVYVGGRFALARQGHEHYLRLGEPATVTLYSPAKLPAWALKLPLREHIKHCGKSPFDWPLLNFGADQPDAALAAQGLERAAPDTAAAGVVFALPERAILELCDEAPDKALVHELDALLQGLATLRPQLLSTLLLRCRSIKAKRLFLALAERQGHAWFAHLDLNGVNLGHGKRALIKDGKLNAKYQITLPADLDEQLGQP